MTPKTIKNSKENMIAKAICDRNFKVPDWMVEMVNGAVMTNIILLTNSDTIFKRYLEEKPVKEFFDKIRKKSNVFSKEYVKLVYATDGGVYSVLTLNTSCWKYLRNKIIKENELSSYTNHEWIIRILADYLLINEEWEVYTKEVLQVLNLNPIYLVTKVNEYLLERNMINEKNERVPRLIKLLKIEKNYSLTQQLLDQNIPVFFEDGDISDLYRYFDVLIRGKWRSELVPAIRKVKISDTETELIQMMRIIFIQLNNKMIVYAKDMLSEEVFTDTFFTRPCGIADLGNKVQIKYFLNKYPVEALRDTHRVDGIAIYGIKDFTDLIHAFGKNQYGLPLWIQIGFIASGGDIRTMFQEGELLQEASIIKSEDQINYLIAFLSIDSIRYLIYNSTDFIKVLLTSEGITQLSIVKLLKALFENPINEELWDVLNGRNTFKGVDYRETIIRKAISYLTLTGVFLKVPEAMLYLSPEVLFVTRNLSEDTIPFIPVNRLVPYLESIIKNHEYIELNRFSEGEYISIDKMIDVDELIKNIVQYKKYGYIGDIITDDYTKLIDEIYKQSN